MFSVDNFYYILDKNLFEPVHLAAWYCHPFGSNSLRPLHRHFDTRLQLLLWDQEPFNFQLYKDSIQARCRESNTNLKPNAVAISDICKESKIVPYNWYYFFHGFAALDWFRDAQYLPLLNNNFSNVFISLNRLVTKERSYRLSLVAELIDRDLARYGSISLMGKDFWRKEIEDVNTRLSPNQIKKISSTFINHDYNLILDIENIPGWASANFGINEIELFQNSFVHLVTETIFYGEKLHLTEKIFRPIAICRPFILAGATHNLAYLKNYGFQTFDKWWDESYDEESDSEIRLSKILEIINQLSKLSTADLKDMYQEMLPVLKFNKEHFFNDFRSTIVNELINNYIELLNNYNRRNKDFYNLKNLDVLTINKLLSR